MPEVNLRCHNDDCTQPRWEYYRKLANWDDPLPSCPTCGGPSYQSLDQSYKRPHLAPDAVVVYQTPDGDFRFPGDPNSLSTARYDRLGYRRIELRSATEVRRFEQHMSKHDRAVAERRLEHREAARAARTAATRSDLRMAMQSMSRFGRDLARAAQSRTDAQPRERPRDTGFHVDAYSNDRGSRMESRDSQGRRRRD